MPEALLPTSRNLVPRARRTYTGAGRASITIKPNLLDREAGTGLEVIRAEAHLVERSRVPLGRPLRLHVGGDVSCADGATLLAGAAKSWLALGGGPVWTYTHRWREISGRTWGLIIAFASIEDPADGRRALRAGYRPALVVREFPDDDLAFRAGGVKYVPCPFESRGMSCTQCRLRLGNLPPKVGIAFQIHGRDAARAGGLAFQEVPARKFSPSVR